MPTLWSGISYLQYINGNKKIEARDDDYDDDDDDYNYDDGEYD